jgi:cytoskeletal protein CcmA (bactofilin family)
MAHSTSDTLNGFIDTGCTIQGELSFSSSFRVDGTVEGTITSEAELVIGPKGRVLGTVRVGRLMIGGAVEGTIAASQLVVLQQGAKVAAEVSTPALVMEEGATLDGRVSMRPERSRDTVAAQREEG